MFDGVKNTILYFFKYTVVYRSGGPEVFYKIGALKNFAKFTGKHLCQSLFFYKVPDVRPATLLKKRLWHRSFLVNFAKFLRTPFLRAPPDNCFWKRKHILICLKLKALSPMSWMGKRFETCHNSFYEKSKTIFKSLLLQSVT